jgi:hypothetical protein
MAKICYGLFDSAEQAQPAVAELTKQCDEHPAFAVHVHEKHLVAQDLPDCGTDLGRNNVISAVGGGVIGMVGGGVAAATLDIMGLSALSGAGFGLISGVLIGILSGMMSGARSPKKPLRDLAAELERGKVIVTVGVDANDHVRLVEDALDRAGGRRIGNA